jgi:hypothetical protein
VGLIGATAGPAAADHETPTKPGANRQTYSYGPECDSYSYDGDTYTYCYEGTSTYKQVGSYGGRTLLYQEKYTSTYSFSVNGSVPQVSTSRGTYMFKAKEGVTQISKGSSSSTYGECSYTSRFLFVNGEIKRDIYDFSCTPVAA